jgi:hypothetical protein
LQQDAGNRRISRRNPPRTLDYAFSPTCNTGDL